MKKINPEDYSFMWKVDNFPYFSVSYWLHGIYRQFDFIVTNKKRAHKFYVSKKDRERLSEQGLKLIEEGMDDFKNRLQLLIDEAKKLFPEIEKRDLAKRNNLVLAKEFEEFILFAQKLWEFFFYTEYFMHDKVQEKAEKLGIDTNDYLTSSPKEVLISKEFYERCQLTKDPTEKALLNHLEKYSFIFYNRGGKTLTLERLKQEIRKIENPDDEIRKIERKHQEIITKRKHHPLTEAIRETAELKFLIRCFINKTIFGDFALIKKYLTEIGKRTGIENFDEYHFKEIIDLLNGQEIQKKNRRTFVLGQFNDWNEILGGEVLEIIELLDGKHDRTAIVLKGNVGSKGHYIGKVKIIPFDTKVDLTKKISEMEKGDVLVTGSTGPEMILACHKAGAIVTDEGGICSHAAIISREMGIPSVIATEIATDVLKDGDLVEVDAHQGIVKKLSS
ncbi:MAG: hypothetical protein KAT77_06200 [Nanoarchaeota archaeon]|nr:hypothetical protein [Nanoarchaeota archaeon]